MNNSKNKNIFDNFDYFRNNSTIKNIYSFFGSRIIDLFSHVPTQIIKNELVDRLNPNHLEKIITIDLKVIKYIDNFNKRSPFKIITESKRFQRVDILFFNMNKYQIKNYLKIDEIYRITGKLTMIKDNFQIIHPTNILKSNETYYFDLLEPQYDLSRKRINKKTFRKLIIDHIEVIKKFKFPDEWIDPDYKKNNWNSFKNSIYQIHFPTNLDDVKNNENARKRLAFDELLSSYLTFYDLKNKFDLKYKLKCISDFSLSPKIISSLSFVLTKDQDKSIKDIKKDISSDKKMYRLVQGDVGSGKTIVALLMVADIVNNGYQAVIMAPTEILARQHYFYFKNYLTPFNIEIEIITGKTKQKIKQKIYEKIKSNEIKILIGTHSVYNESVEFKNLGIIVIDEQHKFGVKQRINLLEKAVGCHTLIMSATPIPRSLSFAMYGEISISNIKTKPSERKEVITSIINTKIINKLLEGIKRKIKNNEQVFWILPTIGSLDSEKENLLTRYEYLKKEFKNKVGLLHGKMNKDEGDEVMKDFQEKRISILVSTTVVEVGINIPNATLMIVEQAEKFGLAQLHQLRGRISRGSLQSHCVLIHSQNLSDNTKERLLILKKSSDGFDIAEKDLHLRGAGDFFGTNQSGLPTWKFFRPYEDHLLIKLVKNNSEKLLRNYDYNEKKISFLKRVFYKQRDFKNYFSV